MSHQTNAWRAEVNDALSNTTDSESTSKLPSIIRKVMEEAKIKDTSERRKLDDDDRKILQQAAERVLEPKVLILLKQISAIEIAPDLICAYITDRDSLARFILDSERSTYLNSGTQIMEILRLKLETRGLLLLKGVAPVQWFDDLCERYATLSILQAQSWSVIQSVMKDSSYGDSNSEGKVLDLWSQNKPIRTIVIRYNLPPSIAETLEKRGITHPDKISQNQAETLASEATDPKIKAAILRLWKEESSEGKTKHNERELQQKNLKQHVEEANVILKSLRNDLMINTDVDKNTIQERLRTVTEKLNINPCQLKESDMVTPDKLREQLIKIENDLLGVSTDLDLRTGSYKSDEELVSRASAGLALYGIYLNGDALTFGRKAGRPILDRPEYCPIQSPSCPNLIQHRLDFSSIESGSNFRTTMESAGSTLAIGLQASGWGFSASGEHKNHSNKEKTEQQIASLQTNNITSMSCHIFSVGAFRIPKSQMKLTIDAESDAKAITTIAKAIKFLSAYGSHISDGTHHLGGIIWRIIEIHSNTQYSFDQLKQISSAQYSNNANLGYSGFGFNGGVSVSTSDFNVKGSNRENTSTSIHAKVEMKVEVRGPSTSNQILFNQILQSNNKTWHVVDRSGFEALIPVWKIMENSFIEEIQQAAVIVRKAWIKQAHNFCYISEINQELQRARIDTFSPLVGNVPSRNEWFQDEPRHQFNEQTYIKKADTLADSISKTNLNTITAHQLQTEIIQFFKQLFHLNYGSHMNLFLELMKGTKLPTFIKSIANHQDKPKMFPTQKILRDAVFTNDERIVLEHGGVKLDEDIIRMLDPKPDGRSDDGDLDGNIWEVPSVPLRQLPLYLTKLKSKLMDGIELADIQKLNQRLNDVLSKNMREYGQNNPIAPILNQYGWHDRAFMSHFTEEHIDALIQALKTCLSTKTKTNTEPDSPMIVPQCGNTQRYANDSKLRSYSMLLIDRPMILNPTDETSGIWLLDTLRHRLRLEPQLERQHTNDNDSDDFFNLSLQTTVTKQGISLNTSIYDTLIDVLSTFNVTGQMEIFLLLLERRAAVPLLIPKSLQKFNYHGPLLDLVSIHIGKDQLKLGGNIDLLRIAVISNGCQTLTETHILVKQIFKIHSLYKLDGKPSCRTTIAELGIGFLNEEPCLVLHVIGDWKPLRLFIQTFANWLLVEERLLVEDENILESLPYKKAQTIIWDCSATNGNGSMKQISEPYKHFIIQGPVSIVSKTLKDGLIRAQEKHKRTQSKTSIQLNRISMPDLIEADIINPITFSGTLQKTKFSTLRTESFVLQNSFKDQATSELQLFSTAALNNPAHKAMLEQNIEKQITLRINSTLKVEKLDIIEIFFEILNQSDQVTRVLAYKRFEEELYERCSQNFKNQLNIENLAWQNYENETEQQKNLPVTEDKQVNSDRINLLRHYKTHWNQARSSTNNSIVTLEHCWRELSHLYAANEKRYSQLPSWASRHLRDGFNLELLDGDAAMINIKWIKAILIQLEKELLIELPNGTKHKPRIFVLSILGVQSSGKSTFLNLMFGVRFRTSVGMCTRGVNMQLIKVDDRKEYDYILILDTEGLRAPEFAGLSNSRLRDNRMATLALLPADATIILNRGESDEAIKELLPVVVKAYLDSRLAENNGGQLSTSIFFVYNQIDTSQAHLLETIEKKLVLTLREDSEKAVTEWRAEQQESDHISAPLRHSHSYMDSAFRDFQHDVNDKKKNDIRVLGFLKHGNVPPDDLPNTIYGIDIIELREHIHSRVTTSPLWKPKDLSAIANYIELVWECIKSSNFQLNFGTAVQRVAHAELEQKMSEIERKLNQKYDTHFRQLELEISGLDPTKSADIHTSLNDYAAKLEGHISNIRRELSIEVQTLLNSAPWNQWESEKSASWHATVDQQKRQWRYLLSDKLNGVLIFQKYIDQYKNDMYKHAKQLFAGDLREAEERRAWTIQKKEQTFNDLFNKQLEKVRQEHRPSADKVEQDIYAVYARNDSVQSKFSVNKDHGRLRKLWDNASKTASDLSATVHQMYVNITDGPTKEERNEHFLRSLLQDVKRSLQSRYYYTDTLVQDTIEITEKKLGKNKSGNSMHEVAHKMVSSFLVSRLTEIQQNWDAKNSVSVRFEQERNHVWTYFQNVSNNLRDFALLSKTLTTIFTEHFFNAFNQSLIIYISNTLRGKNWLLNADVLIGYADLDIISDLQHNKIEEALIKCSDTQKVCQTVLHQLISKEIECVVDSHWKFFKNHVVNSLTLSAVATVEVKTDLAMKYLSELRSTLANLGTDILSKNIPRDSTDYSNCDNDQTGFQTITEEIVRNLPNILPFNSQLISDCATLILKHLRDFTLDHSVRPRCGHPCPLCKSPCTLKLWHSDESHDTYHQPAGLSGVHWYETNTLVYETCANSVQKGNRFRHNEQWYPFQQFCTVFPDWKLPSNQTKLKLREYVFFHYHPQVSKRYNLLPCANVPSNFNHDLETIKNELIEKTGASVDN